MTIPAHYPESIRRILASLLEDLAPCAPEPFAVAVYGSLARGTFREGESDVNLAVVLSEASARVLDSLREPLRKVWRAARVEPLVLTLKELPRIADAFPIKLFDIKQHHDLILGTEPFTELEVKWSDVRVRAEQELRNHLLRLRRSWLLDGGDVRALAPVLFRSASSLLFDLEALLWLKGEELRGLSQDQVFMQAGRVFDLDGGVLEQLVAFRRGTGAVDVQSLFADLLGLVARCVEIADRLEGPG